MRVVVFIVVALPRLAFACQACQDAEAARQSFANSLTPIAEASVPTDAGRAPASGPRTRNSGEPSVGGTSEPVSVPKPRSFIRSFNELK